MDREIKKILDRKREDKDNMTKLRRLLPLTLVLALLILPALAGSALAAPSGKQVAVSMVDYQFQPKTLTINVGDTVVWTNNGATAHTVTASDGSWDSGNVAPGQSFSHTFNTPGTVAYYCMFHGSATGTGMAATITVQAATTQAPAPAATQAPAPAASQAPAPAAPAQPSSGTATIDVSDQPLTDGHITLASVMALQDGWIAVHANTSDNKPGPVIGHAAVKAGMNMNVQVTLSPAPKAGDKVWPMLHIDSGQKGVYEFPGPDSPVIQNGDIVMKQITITSVSTTAAAPAQGTAGTSPAPVATPKALPNTGDNAPSNVWLALVGLGAVLIFGGMLLLAGRADSR